MYHYNVAQWYEQFLQVGRLYRALILLGLAHLPIASVSLVSWCYMYLIYCVIFTLSSGELSLVALVLDVLD